MHRRHPGTRKKREQTKTQRQKTALGGLSELQEAPLEVEFPTETIELESEFSEEWDNDELFEGYAWKQLYGDEGIATYGTVARSHLSEEEKAAYTAGYHTLLHKRGAADRRRGADNSPICADKRLC